MDESQIEEMGKNLSVQPDEENALQLSDRKISIKIEEDTEIS